MFACVSNPISFVEGVGKSLDFFVHVKVSSLKGKTVNGDAYTTS
jgi:hypothetical protein